MIAPLGLGVGWRPELAWWISRVPDLGFVEVLFEDLEAWGCVPAPVEDLRRRGVQVVLHAVSLSLGGAEPLPAARASQLARWAQRLQCPLVSEHLAFVRAGGLESGHLLPLPRTRDALEVLVENATALRAALPAPLALENIAHLVDWPEAELDDAEFLREALDRSGCQFLLDLSNLFANGANHGFDAALQLKQLPLDRLAYVHLGGGIWRNGLYHDTHAHPMPSEALDLLESLVQVAEPPGVMLERDDHFPSEEQLDAEIEAIRRRLRRGG